MNERFVFSIKTANNNFKLSVRNIDSDRGNNLNFWFFKLQVSDGKNAVLIRIVCENEMKKYVKKQKTNKF